MDKCDQHLGGRPQNPCLQIFCLKLRHRLGEDTFPALFRYIRKLGIGLLRWELLIGLNWSMARHAIKQGFKLTIKHTN